MRVPFDSVFKIYKNRLEIKPENVRIGGITFHRWTKIGKGINFSGIDLYNFLGHDLEVKQDNNDLVITGIF